MATVVGKKISQFKPITDVDLAKDDTQWATGIKDTLYKATSKQVKTLVTNIVNAVAPGIFNSMWATIVASEQIITARWKFKIINLPDVTDFTPIEGDIWRESVSDEFRVRKSGSIEDMITSYSNSSLKGTGERLVSANAIGGLQALYDVKEEIVTDNDIVHTCMNATFIVDNIFTATITPPNNKTFYKGQMCISDDKLKPYMYKAINNNTVIRILLG